MSKHDKAQSLSTLAEKSEATPIESQGSQTKVERLEIELLTKQIARGEAEEKLKLGNGDMVELAGNFVKLDAEIKKLEISMSLAKFEGTQVALLDDILAIVAKYPELAITKLYYEMTTTEIEGVTSTMPSVSINEHITRFGKRKASGGGGGKVTQWRNTTTSEVKNAKEVFESLGLNGELAGTAKAGAWGRVLESLHAKGKATDWVVV